MVSVTSPEGAALRAHRAPLEKVMVAQESAVERLKNETPPHEPTSPSTPLTTTVENGTTKAESCRPLRQPRVGPRDLKLSCCRAPRPPRPKPRDQKRSQLCLE